MKKLLLGVLGVTLLVVMLMGFALLSVLGSVFQGGNAPTGVAGGNGNTSIAIAALSMTPFLYNGPPDNYDTWYKPGFPQAALDYWQKTCPGCAAWKDGNLQCVMFAVAAYALAGQPLPIVRNAIDMWPAYRNLPGWQEIPNGTGPPLPGDITILSSPYFGGVGHLFIVLNVTADAQGNGSVTFAQANGPGAVNTVPLQKWSIMIPWTNYTVLGDIRHAQAPHLPTGMPNSKYVQMAWNDAQSAGIRPDVFVKQINAESGFDPNAVSPAGALGIAQFIPATAASLGINPRDPIQSLSGAARLMASSLTQYNGDYAKALAAYNAGPDALAFAVKTYGVNWLAYMPLETRNYVKKILS